MTRRGVQSLDPMAAPRPPVTLDEETIEHLVHRHAARSRYEQSFTAEYDESMLSRTLRRMILASIPTQNVVVRQQLQLAAHVLAGEATAWLSANLTWSRPGIMLSNPIDVGGWLYFLSPTRIVIVGAEGAKAVEQGDERVPDVQALQLQHRVLPLDALRFEQRRVFGTKVEWTDDGFEIKAAKDLFPALESFVATRSPEPFGTLAEMMDEPSEEPGAPQPDWYRDPVRPPGAKPQWRWWDGRKWSAEIYDNDRFRQQPFGGS